MKKIITLIVSLSLITFIVSGCSSEGQKQENPMILSKLTDNGVNNEEREFIFKIENVGKNSTELEFPTWLEYNIGLENLDGKTLPSGDKVFEHWDLNENKDEGRTLVLKPNESIDYRIIAKGVPSGTYELTISSASGFGGVKKRQFTIGD
ncbi:hypothetical protein [Bacillus sp. FJAT-45350]|uniref:hypothetical protein n=1 Tax=Bacillus sp. FJAT-45350 TaxID=2011014 RepID=UPI000BB990F7|nr:hypothetical protein [Bacillus sp. FJAT-45350]